MIVLPFLLLLSHLIITRTDCLCPSPNYVDLEPISNIKSVIPNASLSDNVPLPPASSPLILPRNNSQLITLPSFPLFPDHAYYDRLACPHLQDNLKSWHDPNTWPSKAVPLMDAGSNISIPANTKVLLSSCSIPSNVVLGIITIPYNSSLILADANITLRVTGFNVQGSLEAGSETCRLLSSISIILYGKRPHYGKGVNYTLPEHFKGISVTGSLDLHSALYNPTWTRLAFTAKVGDIWIYLQDVVNWEVGHSIVITTSVLKDSREYHENEVRLVSAIYRLPISHSTEITAIRLNQSLSYIHYAGPEYQVEVALLTRRMIIMGSIADSEPNDSKTDCTHPNYHSRYPCGNSQLTGFGGHIHVRGSARISGVQLVRMGQTNTIGRYPIHFHMIGEVNITRESYVQDSSVWTSYFRCYAIHGSYGVRISRNVAYDVIGHCYYLEDGVEERNIIEFNFGGLVHFFGADPVAGEGTGSGQQLGDYYQSEMLLLPADIAASVFYITNNYNTIVGNSASGGWAGFSFPNLATPIGLHRDMNLKPSSRPSLRFDGNTAHSSGYWWGQAGCMYSGGTLSFTNSSSDQLKYNPGRGEPGGSGVKSGSNIFNNTKTFLCNVGFLHWGNNAVFNGFETHDFMRSMTVFGKVGITGALLNCRSSNIQSQKIQNPTWFEKSFYSWSLYAFQWYDVSQMHILTNATFRNCINVGSRQMNAWNFLTHSDQFVPQMMQATRDISYQNVSTDTLMSFSVTNRNTTSGRLQNWFDVDGSTSLRAGTPTNIGSIFGLEWWKLDSNCTRKNAWNVWLCDAINPVTKRVRSVGSVQIGFDESLQNQIGKTICTNGGSWLPCDPVATVMHIGYNNISNGLPLSPNARVTGSLNGFGWFVSFYGKKVPKKLTFSNIQVGFKDTMIMAFQYPRGTKFSISAVALGCPVGASWCLRTWPFRAVDSLDAVRISKNSNSGADVYYFDERMGHIYFQLVIQRNWNLGNGKNWSLDVPYELFTFDGITIVPPTYEGYRIVLDASCPASTIAGDYCILESVEMPQSPCKFQTAYDFCGDHNESYSFSLATTSISQINTMTMTMIESTVAVSKTGVSAATSIVKEKKGEVIGKAATSAFCTIFWIYYHVF